jgi:uncharacterized protein with PQ loop repeat
MFLNTVMWCVYGALTQSLAVYLPNAVGAVLSLYFLLTFHSLTPRRGLLLAHLLPAFAGVVVVAAVVSFADMSAGTRRDIAGGAAIAILMGAMVTPLAVMGRVVALRSCEAMSLPVAVASLGNSALWCAYGILVDDVYVTAPNGVLTITSLAQVALFVIFDREAFSPRRIAEELAGFAFWRSANHLPSSSSSSTSSSPLPQSSGMGMGQDDHRPHDGGGKQHHGRSRVVPAEDTMPDKMIMAPNTTADNSVQPIGIGSVVPDLLMLGGGGSGTANSNNGGGSDHVGSSHLPVHMGESTSAFAQEPPLTLENVIMTPPMDAGPERRLSVMTYRSSVDNP